MGNAQIAAVGEDRWIEYPFWRKENSAQRSPQKHPKHKTLKAPTPEQAQKREEGEGEHKTPKEGSIWQEMMTFRAIMRYAARKHYIRESQVPKGDMPEDKNRHEAFMPEEYKQLHTYACNTCLVQVKSLSAGALSLTAPESCGTISGFISVSSDSCQGVSLEEDFASRCCISLRGAGRSNRVCRIVLQFMEIQDDRYCRDPGRN